MGAPPKAREGNEAASAGRPIVAGVSPFLRTFSPRSTTADLWAVVDLLGIDPQGPERLRRLHGVRIDGEARRRYSAYVAQARQYFEALPRLEPIAKPLMGYYFALNLTKAFLTAMNPATTSSAIGHGLSEAFKKKQRYHFQQEAFRVRERGVFRLLAENTGAGFCYAANHQLRIVDLLPYLPDAYDTYAEIKGESPKLLPITDAFVLFGSKSGWLRVEIDRNVLRQRNTSPSSVLKKAAIFGKRFRLVATDRQDTASYESMDAHEYSRKRSEILEALCSDFDQALVAVRRNVGGSATRYLVLSTRTQLLSHEAVAFAVLHHLSNMVRYRPQDVERLRGTGYFWLFTSWVDRACENFLLALASRITGEEHVVV